MPAVIMMAILTVAAVSTALRLKRAARRYEPCSEAVEHVFDHMIGPNAEKLVVNFSRQMAISQVPGETHELTGFSMADFDNVFCSRLHPEQSPVVELQGISIRHGDRFRKLEKDLFALIRGQPNAAAMARVKIERDRSCGPFFRPMSGWSMN